MKRKIDMSVAQPEDFPVPDGISHIDCINMAHSRATGILLTLMNENGTIIDRGLPTYHAIDAAIACINHANNIAKDWFHKAGRV